METAAVHTYPGRLEKCWARQSGTAGVKEDPPAVGDNSPKTFVKLAVPPRQEVGAPRGEQIGRLKIRVNDSGRMRFGDRVAGLKHAVDGLRD
jgi:hypothetical protein